MSNQLGLYVVGDSRKCTGCRACEIACFVAHNREKNRFGGTVGTVTIPVIPKLYLVKTDTFCIPVQCKHCEDAPCLNACTKNAIYRYDHQIIIDEDKCIGCKDCMMACPFGSITLLPICEGGTAVVQDCGDPKISASKCDLCKDIKGGPACVNACPNNALKLVYPEDEANNKRLNTAMALAAQSNNMPLEENESSEK